MAVESIDHLFWECDLIQYFWNNLFDVLAQCNLNVARNKFDVFLYTKSQILSYIYSFAKFYIYQCKFKNVIPNIDAFCADPENFMPRGSNENRNFWSQTGGGGGPTPQKSRNYHFLGKIFKFQGGGSGPPVPPSGSAHEIRYRKILEQHIAIKNDKVQEYNDTWNSLQGL